MKVLKELLRKIQSSNAFTLEDCNFGAMQWSTILEIQILYENRTLSNSKHLILFIKHGIIIPPFIFFLKANRLWIL